METVKILKMLANQLGAGKSRESRRRVQIFLYFWSASIDIASYAL